MRQTFWSVAITLISHESKSRSTSALLEDGGHQQFELVALYRNTPRASVRGRSEVHHGAVRLEICGQPVSRLEGYYWTDRNTIGELTFAARSRKIVDSFAAARELGL